MILSIVQFLPEELKMKERYFLELTDEDKERIFETDKRQIEWALWQKNLEKNEIKLPDELCSLKDFILSDTERTLTWFNLAEQASENPTLIRDCVRKRQVREIETFLDEGITFIRFQERKWVRTIKEYRDNNAEVELSQFFNHILN